MPWVRDEDPVEIPEAVSGNVTVTGPASVYIFASPDADAIPVHLDEGQSMLVIRGE